MEIGKIISDVEIIPLEELESEPAPVEPAQASKQLTETAR